MITEMFGRNMRVARNKLGISQEALAELCGLHRTYVGSVERGERNITLVNAEKIAHALKIDLRDLVGQKSNERDRRS
jgi:transcriptional regulator with XRE-family HTH domain